jgi:hypothetical protein
VREGDLVERFDRAGLQGVTGGTLETSVDYADFNDYWELFTGAAGPATGAFYASLDDAGKATLRDTVRASLPEGPFTLPARAGNRSRLKTLSAAPIARARSVGTSRPAWRVASPLETSHCSRERAVSGAFSRRLRSRSWRAVTPRLAGAGVSGTSRVYDRPRLARRGVP